MPIEGSGWELLVRRVDKHEHNGKQRTVGTYQVFWDGVPRSVRGMCAETRGPGSNAVAGNNRCVEAGRYPLNTQAGTKYVTLNYTLNVNPAALPRPGIELGGTGNRSEILIHPARGYLWSVGCINPASALPHARSEIDFEDSRMRVIALIADMTEYLGDSFPKQNGRRIPDSWVVVEDAA
jgi:hypothetical protein